MESGDRQQERQFSKTTDQDGVGWPSFFFWDDPVLTLQLREYVNRARAQIYKKIVEKYFDRRQESLEGISPSNGIKFDEVIAQL